MQIRCISLGWIVNSSTAALINKSTCIILHRHLESKVYFGQRTILFPDLCSVSPSFYAIIKYFILKGFMLVQYISACIISNNYSIYCPAHIYIYIYKSEAKDESGRTAFVLSSMPKGEF